MIARFHVESDSSYAHFEIGDGPFSHPLSYCSDRDLVALGYGCFVQVFREFVRNGLRNCIVDIHCCLSLETLANCLNLAELLPAPDQSVVGT